MNSNAHWPEYMSLPTVAKYCDLPGSSNTDSMAKRAKRFCLEMGIPVLDIAGTQRRKKVRKKDIDLAFNPVHK